MLVNGLFLIWRRGPVTELVPAPWITTLLPSVSADAPSRRLLLSNLWDERMLCGGREKGGVGAIDPGALTPRVIHHQPDHSSTHWHFHLDTHGRLSPFSPSHIHPSLHPPLLHPPHPPSQWCTLSSARSITTGKGFALTDTNKNCAKMRWHNPHFPSEKCDFKLWAFCGSLL